MNPESIRIHKISKTGMEIHTLFGYPKECCGVLFGHINKDGQAQVIEALPLENNAEEDNSGRQYIVDPLSLYKWEIEGRKRGMEIVGFYHSHPDKKAILSGEDERRMIPGQVYIILSVEDRKCKEISAWKKQTINGKAGRLVIDYEEIRL